MTLAQIYNVARMGNLENLEVCISDEVHESKVAKVDVGFYDSNYDQTYYEEEIEDHIIDASEEEELSYIAYESRYITKVLVLS